VFDFWGTSKLVKFGLGLWLAYMGWEAFWLIYVPFAPSAAGSDGYNFVASGDAAIICTAIWGLVAGWTLRTVIANPYNVTNGPRAALGVVAVLMMMGSFGVGGAFGVFGALIPIPFWVDFLLIPPAMALLGLIEIYAVIFGVLLVAGILFGVPSFLFTQIFNIEKNIRVMQYQRAGLAGYVGRFLYWIRNEPLPEAPPDDSRGARMATPQEIAAVHQPVPESMAFGHVASPLVAGAVSPLFLKTDKHVLIQASTRSGKGVTLIIPHLLRYTGSAFVLDPKGENAKATGRQRSRLNGKVHYLDPFGISGKPKSRFNPLSRFTPENMEAESKALAAALFLVGGERDHWTASGQQLLASIILYVFVSPAIPPEKKDLPTVRRILLGGLNAALNDMTKLDEADGLLRDLAFSFLTTPEKEFGSIVSTAQRQTEILDNPYIAASLSAAGDGEEVDFKAWQRGTMTVYLCLAAPKFPVFNRWLRLVLAAALDEMTETLNPPPLPVCFMLDELATLGHMESVENAVGLAAGYGIQLVTVFQDVAQMRDLYKGRWASFIGNAGVRALFNLDDYETADYWSKFIGGQVIETRSRQEDIYGYYNSEGISETLRPLFPPDKIMMDFSSGKMLVLAQGAHPIITERVAYWQDASLAKLWDDPRKPPLWQHAAASSAQPEPPPEPEKKEEWWQTGGMFAHYSNVIINNEPKPPPPRK
jgi:type IV secretion system protein VirD4